MIIEISSRNYEEKILMPKLYLDPAFNYVIGIKQLYMELSDNIDMNSLIYLKSSLIDTSSFNQNQSILTIPVKTKPIVMFNPTRVLLLPLQKFNLESASFDFYEFWSNSKIEFKKVFIQLEIEKLRYGDRF